MNVEDDFLKTEKAKFTLVLIFSSTMITLNFSIIENFWSSNLVISISEQWYRPDYYLYSFIQIEEKAFKKRKRNITKIFKIHANFKIKVDGLLNFDVNTQSQLIKNLQQKIKLMR